MNHLYGYFSHIINNYYINNTKIILGLSGGLDSRVMLDLLARYRDCHRIRCIAVHVDHGLSQFSDNWAKQCVRWCADLAIPCHVERIQLNVSSPSLEKVARDIRYQIFKKYIKTGDLFLTGHHSDDQVETFFLALKRGSGPKGLSAMPQYMPYHSGFILRPLLSFSRTLIQKYAQKKQLCWIEDESNNDLRFDRNFIRHQVLPTLIKRWSSFSQSVNQSAMLCADQEILLDELLSSSFQAALYPDGSLLIKELNKHSQLARNRIIRMWFKKFCRLMPNGKCLRHIWQQVALAKQDANPLLRFSDGEIRRFKQRLYLLDHMIDISNLSFSLKLGDTIKLPDNLGFFSVKKNSRLGTISLHSIGKKKINIIFNPEGLSAHPLGKKHSRKLKKIFQEYSIPSWLRRRIPILVVSSQVVAVAGLFVDKKFSGQGCELIWKKTFL
ncbi:tRNA(Ile)-lysidine synthase [Candidatus Photodesmus katoptron]|uniref:tRNA lysidine(34) synthetase TilS n=1 Tax=Candidatus Photodesmus anomalopis TaxID=28176 RepID=UPI0004D40D4E|nr:tRNA lysidine(34) synthetase TilS [Candidatus Photodesmus katoptron]KEY90367.1 tRNA(Ile)-lysidine synthase [Candidatus Photodesmus katoptron]